jgi:hypothetical protein
MVGWRVSSGSGGRGWEARVPTPLVPPSVRDPLLSGRLLLLRHRGIMSRATSDRRN